MKTSRTKFDPAELLDSQEAVDIFIADAMETGDASFIAKSLGIIARAKGVSEVAQETGLSREQLYRSFSEEGNPTLKNMLKVMSSLGISLTTKPAVERH